MTTEHHQVDVVEFLTTTEASARAGRQMFFDSLAVKRKDGRQIAGCKLEGDHVALFLTVPERPKSFWRLAS